MKITELPPDVQDFLATCPKTGHVNPWLFPAALKLHRANVPLTEMRGLLHEATKKSGRIRTDYEIDRAISNSGQRLDADFHVEHRAPKWPKRNREQIAAIIRDGAGLDDLKEISPVKWNDGKPHTEEIIDILFPGNPLLCVGLSNCSFNTMARERWRGLLAARQFIVPSPMTKRVGVTKDGKPSEHCLDNTGLRRFLVVEFDRGSFDQHAAILFHLARYAPLVMAVHSGSKSLHGWFFVHGQPEDKVGKFFRYAVSLGADPQLWVRSQFVRLPDGWRYGKNKRQAVLYFNPSTIKNSHAN